MFAASNTILPHFLGIAYRLLRPALFQLDAESAHDCTLAALASIEELLCRARYAPRPFAHPALECRLFGLSFSNPVGVAAGLDKDARAPHVWPLLGFGFAELGTVTAEPQPGNPAPRLFRFPAEQAIVNRMGFNNAGAEQVARTLARAFSRLAPSVPIGINIGKSRAVPLEAAPDDYARSFQLLAPWADYVCVNVSSPNTPGLRALQARAQLEPLLRRLQAENRAWAERSGSEPRPLFVKVAPDLGDAALEEVAALGQEMQLAGLVATNTTTDLSALPQPPPVEGGLSGAPLRTRATEVVRKLYQLTRGTLPIIGVGGILNARDAYEKIRAGASLLQVYTGLVFEGPALAARICEELVALLERDGFRHLREAVGCAA